MKLRKKKHVSPRTATSKAPSVTSKYPTACKDYDGSSIYKNAVAYNLHTPKDMVFFPISNLFCSACHGKNATTSHFSTTTKATWDLWDLLSEKKMKKSLGDGKNEHSLHSKGPNVFLPHFFRKSQVELRLPSCFCRPPSITCSSGGYTRVTRISTNTGTSKVPKTSKVPFEKFQG